MSVAILKLKCTEYVPPPKVNRPEVIYFLVKADVIVYVGRTIVLEQRLRTHRRRFAFDRVLFRVVPNGKGAAYENALIRALRPERNNLAAPHVGGDNEALAFFGLPALADEKTNARDFYAWLRAKPERQKMRRNQVAGHARRRTA